MSFKKRENINFKTNFYKHKMSKGLFVLANSLLLFSCSNGEQVTSERPNIIFIITDVDDGVGSFFDALEKNGQLDNTIIIYTSDNSMLMGEHGQFHKKRWAYDQTIRIPFFIRYPKLIRKGSKRNQMVLNIDLAPTIYEITGVEPLIPIHGKSFVPLLKNKNADWRKSFFAEYFHEKVAHHVPAWKMIRTENWKYIQYELETEDMNELYDLKNDPKEEYNLFHDPAYQGELKKLKAELKKRIKEVESKQIEKK